MLKKFKEAVFALTTLAVTTDPVIIDPSPPIILATTKESATIEVFLN